MEHGAGPLAGVRVVDLTDDLGRFAGKLLAELGADVVRLRQGEHGVPMRGVEGGLLDWWYDTSTSSVPLDLHDDGDRASFVELVTAADLLVESEPPGRLDSLGVGPARLAAHNPRLVHVSLTPFGSDGPRAGWQGSDLVASASGGILSVTGFPDDPVNSWGRQMVNVGGFYAAIIALAGLARVRATGRGLHADLSLQQAAVSCSEHVMMFWFYPEILAPLGPPVPTRKGSLHWTAGYQVVPCKRGYCMVSPTAGGLPDLIAWMKSQGIGLDLPDEVAASEGLAMVPRLMTALREFALTVDAHDLFLGGQERHVPFGEVLTVPEVADCPQHRARGFFRPVQGAEGITIPGPFARFTATPCPPPTPPPRSPTAPAEVLGRWPRDERAGVPPSGGAARLPLEGIRVVDFTHVLAGPFATRVLADLGADILKMQTEGRCAGAHANEFPYFGMWNRSKRSFCLDMSRPDALPTLRRLVEQADVVIENFSAGVLDRWGAGWEVLHRWNPSLTYLAMQGAGTDGPWRDFVTFAPTVHALAGLTALTGPEGRLDCGTGPALNDHVSGLAGALAVLAALEARRRTGEGQFIDLSQLEMASYLVGPALVDWTVNGREARAAGNRDAFTDPVPNDVVRSGDGGWLAVTCRDDADWSRLAPLLGLDDPGLAGVEGRRARRDEVTRRLREWAATRSASAGAEALQELAVPAYPVLDAQQLAEEDPQLAARRWLVELDSPLFGRQQTDRFPAVLHDADGDELELRYSPSPYLSEHTFEVGGELLGLDDAEVGEQIAKGLFV